MTLHLSIGRWTTMLCIALTLVFAGASLSGVLDDLQHAPGAPAEHEHLLFSPISLEPHHAEHHAPQPDQDSPADHLAGHHHHGDNGPGLVVPGSAGTAVLALTDDLREMMSDRQAPGWMARGPERPPKA